MRIFYYLFFVVTCLTETVFIGTFVVATGGVVATTGGVVVAAVVCGLLQSPVNIGGDADTCVQTSPSFVLFPTMYINKSPNSIVIPANTILIIFVRNFFGNFIYIIS